MEAIESQNGWTLEEAQGLQLVGHSPVYEGNCAGMLNFLQVDTLEGDLAGLAAQMSDWDGSHSGDQVEPTLYYRWMYRTIEAAMADEFKKAAGDSAAAEKFATWHRTIVSENSFPKLLANPNSPWWDNVSTSEKENAEDVVSEAFKLAWDDLRANLGPDPMTWRYDRLHTVTHKHAMGDVPFLGDWLSVGPFGLGAAKDALCKYEFKLKHAVDYSIFSGPSMRIGIDFADVDGGESILPTGQSGNVFSAFYDNQAPLYHAGEFRKMRMDRADIEAHSTAVASIRPLSNR